MKLQSIMSLWTLRSALITAGFALKGDEKYSELSDWLLTLSHLPDDIFHEEGSYVDADPPTFNREGGLTEE